MSVSKTPTTTCCTYVFLIKIICLICVQGSLFSFKFPSKTTFCRVSLRRNAKQQDANDPSYIRDYGEYILFSHLPLNVLILKMTFYYQEPVQNELS